MQHDIQKIRNAVLDMMSKIDFDEKDHRYVRKSDGKWLAGISSIASTLPKEFLIPWAAKETVVFLGYEDDERAADVLGAIKGLDVKGYQEILHEAKLAYKTKSGDALIDGTNGHAYLEKYVKAKIRGTDIPELEEPKLRRTIDQFIEWEKNNIDTWILSEAKVTDTEEEYAGTMDAMAITKEGKLAIVDFKFANQIGDDYHLQTAGYALPFKKYGIEIEDRIVLRLPKTLQKRVYDKKTRTYSMEDNNIEWARSPHGIEYDQEIFLHARHLYKYANANKRSK